MTSARFLPEDMVRWPKISREIWAQKYQLKRADGTVIDQTWDQTVARVARAAASVEHSDQKRRWENAFRDVLQSMAFIPGGRILAGAGADRAVTLFNCYVMGRIDDDLGAIFENVKEAALTLQMGGGIGQDFSTLRPKGALVNSLGADASGPVSFMDVWDAMCRTIMSAGARRGAMMATLRCDHPDIETFIEAKREAGRLRNFNLSVLVTDAFVHAIRAGQPWPLAFNGEVVRTVDARALWEKLMRASYDVAEPGVVFIDRINKRNNLSYAETIAATNPCGEQPLPAYGACLLGAINLTAFVTSSKDGAAQFDVARLEATVAIAVRFLDNVIDVSTYPLEAQKREAFAKRRIGLGVTGLADALIMLGVRYGSSEAQRLVGDWLGVIKCVAYATSADLAVEKGAFPLSNAKLLLERPNIATLPDAIKNKIVVSGLRNGCLTTIAPTGTTSLLAGNISSGIEPVFAWRTKRRVLGGDGTPHFEQVEDFAYRQFRAAAGEASPLPEAFVTAETLTPNDHLLMQAAAQPHIDSAISKTINVPQSLTFDAFQSIYLDAFDLGLKGCTTYRTNAVTGAVLTVDDAPISMSPEPGRSVDPADDRDGRRTIVRRDGSAAASAEANAVAPPRLVVPHILDHVGERRSREGAVVYMAKPVERDQVLSGFTYKLRWPRSEHAIYITINDVAIDGHLKPFEIFINSKNLEHYAWTVALTRMISAVFRRGGDVSFVVEELKAVFDPQGGAWIDGRYVPSLLAAIGDVIEKHLNRLDKTYRGAEVLPQHALNLDVTGSDVRKPVSGTGFDKRRTDVGVGGVGWSEPQLDKTGDRGSGSARLAATESGASRSFQSNADTPMGRTCPKCSRPTYHRYGGCWSCDTCHFSQCE